MAGTGSDLIGLGSLVALLCVLSLPVIFLNISLHNSIQELVPGVGSAGVKQALISSMLFTPLEAALVLPAINLFYSGRVLRGFYNPPNKYVQQGR